MPMYKYRCTECGSQIEKLQSHTEMILDRERLRCAKCEAPMQHIFGVPAVRTPSTFYRGRGDGFGNDDFKRRIAYARARAAGVNPTGKVYVPGLARPKCPNDPQAWVSQMDAEAEIRKRATELNYGVEGDFINVPQREPETDPLEKPYRAADDIVEKAVNETVQREYDGKIDAKKRADLVEATRERASGNQ